MAVSKKKVTRRKPVKSQSNGARRTRRNFSATERKDYVDRYRVSKQDGVTQGEFCSQNEIGVSSLVRWLEEFPETPAPAVMNGRRVESPSRTLSSSSRSVLDTQQEDHEMDCLDAADEVDPDAPTSDLQAGRSLLEDDDSPGTGVAALLLPAPKTPEQELQEKDDRIHQLEDELFETKNKLLAMERLVQAATGVRQLGA